jgi:hypothetical protein
MKVGQSGCARHRLGLDIRWRPCEPRGLKHRPDGATRTEPIPPLHGAAPDRWLFRGTRGGMLSESVDGRTWHAARDAALGPQLAATALARRPSDLRHDALSLRLDASGSPAEVAWRAGNSVPVLEAVYAHCVDGHDQIASRRVENALQLSSPHVRASGPPNRLLCPDPVRYMSVISGPVERATANCRDLRRRVERAVHTRLSESSHRSGCLIERNIEP